MPTSLRLLGSPTLGVRLLQGQTAADVEAFFSDAGWTMGAEVDNDMMMEAADELAGTAFSRVVDRCRLVNDMIGIEAGPIVAKMAGLSVDGETGSCQIRADVKKECGLRGTPRKTQLGVFLPVDLAVAVIVFAAREKPTSR